MDDVELASSLRSLIDEEQDLYRRYLELVDQTGDLELQEVFGHHAFEQFTHLNTIIDKYKELMDDLEKKGVL